MYAINVRKYLNYIKEEYYSDQFYIFGESSLNILFSSLRNI